MALSSLINKFEKIKVIDIVRDAANNTAEDWAELNREQLLHGLNSQGQPVGEYRSPVYAEVKNRINPLPGFGVPDLKNTGAFHDAIFMRAKGGQVITSSSDWKLSVLEKKYGKSILGLNSEYKKLYIFGAFYNDIKKQLSNVL